MKSQTSCGQINKIPLIEVSVETRRQTIDLTRLHPIWHAKETLWVPYRSNTHPRLGRINRINIVEEKLCVKIGALSRYGLSCLLIHLSPFSLAPCALLLTPAKRSIDEGACKTRGRWSRLHIA